MVQESWPFEENPIDEDRWAVLWSAIKRSGVLGDPGSATAQVYADSSGMHVFVRPGEAMIVGGWWGSDATEQVAIPLNSGPGARIDRIVLKRDPVANSTLITRVAGTPGGSAPALTQDTEGVYMLPLAQVRVEQDAVTITAAKVTDERWFAGIEVVPCITLAQGPPPRRGEIRYEYASDKHFRWNGTTYREFALKSSSSEFTSVDPGNFIIEAGNPYTSVLGATGSYHQLTYLPGGRLALHAFISFSVGVTGGQRVFLGGGMGAVPRPYESNPTGNTYGNRVVHGAYMTGVGAMTLVYSPAENLWFLGDANGAIYTGGIPYAGHLSIDTTFKY